MSGSEVNKYGLRRRPPAEIRRRIRQECGFGCVMCGLGLYDYEHIEPEFHEAREHDPSKMALLCYRCHGRVTKGWTSKEQVKTARANPFCLRQGFARETLVPSQNPVVKIGGAEFSSGFCLAVAGQFPVLMLLPNTEPGLPFRLSATFCTSKGDPSFLIKANEWRALTDNFDVETTGMRITIREQMGKIHLRLNVSPPDLMEVESLDMRVDSFHIYADQSGLTTSVNGGLPKVQMSPGSAMRGIFLWLLRNKTRLVGPFPQFIAHPELFILEDPGMAFLTQLWELGFRESPYALLKRDRSGTLVLVDKRTAEPFRTGDAEELEEYLFAALCLGNNSPPTEWTSPW